AGIIDKLRHDTAAKAIRDDYTAFNHVAIAYTMLHTTAMALHDNQTMSFAEEGLRTYAGPSRRSITSCRWSWSRTSRRMASIRTLTPRSLTSAAPPSTVSGRRRPDLRKDTEEKTGWPDGQPVFFMLSRQVFCLAH